MKAASIYCFVLAVAVTFCPVAGAQDGAPTKEQIERAIGDLGSGDPAVRDAAAEAIMKMGGAARPALLKAAEDDDPAIRAAAAALLQKLPWYMPGDPPDFRELLTNYAKVDAAGRQEIVGSLAKMNGGFRVLARLIVEEPNDAVKWAIVAAVRQHFVPADLELFRRLPTDAAAASAPLLAAAGHAWFVKDATRGVQLLRRSFEVYLKAPGDDQGEMDGLCARLIAMALLADKPDEAARILRLRAAKAPAAGAEEEDEDEAAPSALALFALHARMGPLSGFDGDLKRFGNQSADGRMVFCIAEMYRRSGQELVASALVRCAFGLSGEPKVRMRVGDFLLHQGWTELAGAQWNAILADQNASIFERANAHFRLSQLAVGDDDDAAAAEHLRQAISAHRQGQGELRGTTEQLIDQEIAWRELRAARKKNDAAAGQKAAASLLALTDFGKAETRNPDIGIDLVQFFTDQKRPVEAEALFTKIYEGLKAELATDPENPTKLNNVAWFCASLGRNKEEALACAQKAVKAVPDNAPLLDTLAEAQYQAGHWGEALRIEERAYKLRPWDQFLKRQIEKFRAAGK